MNQIELSTVKNPMANITYTKLVHDFGLVTWPLITWEKLGPEGIQRMADQAPAGWWRRTILQFLHNGITRTTSTRIEEAVIAGPMWLLNGDHTATYLNPRVVPRDLTRTIFGYLSNKIETSTSAAHIIKTTFCGVEHSINNRPAFIEYSSNQKFYMWYYLGYLKRSGNLPNTIQITKTKDNIAWLININAKTNVRCEKRIVRHRSLAQTPERAKTQGVSVCNQLLTTYAVQGDGSPADLEVEGYLQDLE